MGVLYSTQTSAVTLAEARDFYEVLAATAKPVLIHGWFLYQISDVGDAAEEIVRLDVVRGVGTVTSGSGGTSPSVHPINDNHAAVAATIEANNTTRMVVGTGTLETLESYGWNVRIPWFHLFTPELRPRVNPGDRWTLALPTAPTDALTFGSTLWLEEI